MSGNAGVRGVGGNNCGLKELPDGFQVCIAWAEKKGLCCVEESETECPG